MKLKKIFILLILLIPAIFAGGIVKAEAITFGVYAKKVGTSNKEKITGVEYEIYQDSCSSGTKLFSGATIQGAFARHSIESGTTICIKPTKVPSSDYKLPGETITTVTGSNSTHGIILEENTNKTKISFAYAITDKTDGHMIDSAKIRIKKGGVKNNQCTGTDNDIILKDGYTSSTPVITDPYEYTTAPSKVCIELVEEIAGYQYPAAQEFTVDSDLVNTYLVLDKESTDEPSQKTKLTYYYALRYKESTSEYVSGKIRITDGGIKNNQCTGEEILTDTLGPTLLPSSMSKEHTTVPSKVCIELAEEIPGYEYPSSREFGIDEIGNLYVELVKTSSIVTHPTIKVGFKYKDKYVKGIQFAIYKKMGSGDKCSTILKNGLTSISKLQSLELDSLELKEMPSSVCIEVAQSNLGNYSVKEHAMYTVKNGVVEIELGDKVISPDTMSNVSIIVISAGLIVLILGSYLLYTNKINKEENSTEN